MFNFTEDAHPIPHSRDLVPGPRTVTGSTDQRGIRSPGETGRKELQVIAYPGEITRVKALFDRVDLFVRHCQHQVEHEDHEMMPRPYRVGPLTTRRQGHRAPRGSSRRGVQLVAASSLGSGVAPLGLRRWAR